MNILNSINHNKGNFLVFTPFMFDISLNTGGTLANNIIGTANNYPISFINNKSYGVITNFNKDTIDGKSFTLYIKTKIIANTSNNYNGIQAIIFTDNNNGPNKTINASNFFSIPVIYNNGQRHAYYYKSNITIVEVFINANILTNPFDYLHIFIRFDQTIQKVNYACYNKNATSGEPISNTYSYTGNPFSTFTQFLLGNYAYVAFQTFDIAGWYNSYLTTNDMVKIVQKSPN